MPDRAAVRRRRSRQPSAARPVRRAAPPRPRPARRARRRRRAAASAVLASASADARTETCSRAGMSSRRTAALVKAGSQFCGSSHGSQAERRARSPVCARRIRSSGRRYRPERGAIPASERAPEPRARPEQYRLSLIVQGVPEHESARRAQSGSAACVQRGVPGLPRGRFGPWSPDVAAWPGARSPEPSAPGRARARPARRRPCAATSAEPGWSPWSMVTAPRQSPPWAPRRPARLPAQASRRRPSRRRAPGHRAPGWQAAPRTACRIARRPGAGPPRLSPLAQSAGARCRRRGRRAPARSAGFAALPWSAAVCGEVQTLLKVGHAGLFDHCLDEMRALLVLLHLEVDAEDPADRLLYPARPSRAGQLNFALISATDGTTAGPTASIT